MVHAPDHDQALESEVAFLLRAGVVLAAVLVLAGAAVYLVRHGGEQPDYREFREESPELRQPTRIVENAFSGSGRGIIQLGLLALLATPLARVAVMLVAFVRRRNWVYSAASLLVLAALCWGLLSGSAL
ncbi:MAG: DUF1634 domain-containing protein [Gemmataceae bacterium]